MVGMATRANNNHIQGAGIGCIGNYRAISLIDVAAKVFGVILLRRLQLERDQRTHLNQSGLRPGQVCTNQMYNLRRTLEQLWS